MKSILYSSALALILTVFSGCLQNGQLGIRGEGPEVERKLNLSQIKGISLPGSAQVFLTQGSEQEVRITGQENIIENLNREVNGEVWEIHNIQPVWQSKPVKIFITLETIRLLKISGSGDVEFVNHFTDQKDLEIRISGSGKVALDIDARDIKGSITGSGDLAMKGVADYLDISISGSGSVRAYNLQTQKADVRISGSGGMELSVEDDLDAHVTGSGSVSYKGSPKVSTSITGSGSVTSH